MTIYKVEWFIPEFNIDGAFVKYKTYELFSKREDAEKFTKDLNSFAKKLHWKWFNSSIREEEVQ